MTVKDVYDQPNIIVMPFGKLDAMVRRAKEHQDTYEAFADQLLEQDEEFILFVNGIDADELNRRTQELAGKYPDSGFDREPFLEPYGFKTPGFERLLLNPPSEVRTTDPEPETSDTIHYQHDRTIWILGQLYAIRIVRVLVHSAHKDASGVQVT